MGTRVLVCEDEPSFREMLEVLLRRARYRVEPVATVAHALEALSSSEASFDAVVTDLALPDGSGMDVLQEALKRDPATQVVMVTAYGTTEQAVQAMRLGAYDYLEKPFRNQELLALLEKAIEKRAIVDENRVLREAVRQQEESGGLIGKSAPMRSLVHLVRRVASARTSVLITGESGTGKEVVARALHEVGERKSGPFVVVNCGALPENLMESELFGHEKGAFTGAIRRNEGLVRGAEKGTLFLDEIGELSPMLQVKLLRVLQERKVRPVGGTQELDVDVRVVAATNRDIASAVKDGSFRQDLYYRLNVIHIKLPPLREREEDIPLLANHFLAKFGVAAGKRFRFSSAAMRWLGQQSFPGNVRELENVVERAVTLTESDVIGLDDLSEETRASVFHSEEIALGQDFDLDAYLGEIEARLLRRALRESGGVRKDAARLVGMSFRSFRYRLAKFNLNDDDESESPKS